VCAQDPQEDRRLASLLRDAGFTAVQIAQQLVCSTSEGLSMHTKYSKLVMLNWMHTLRKSTKITYFIVFIVFLYTIYSFFLIYIWCLG